MIQIQGPDGAVNQFPDGTSDDVIKAAMAKQYGGPQSTSTAADVAKSGATGVEKGAISLPGIAGDIGSAYDWLSRKATELPMRGAEKLGMLQPGTTDAFLADADKMTHDWQSPAQNAGAVNNVLGVDLPTSKGLQDAVGHAQGGYYQPQTTAGKYAETVGEFMPAAAIGPSSMGKKLLSGALAGTGSEAAGQATAGTAAEPYARIAGALAGGMLPMAGDAALASQAKNSVIENAPSEEALAARAKQAYKVADESGVTYTPQSYLNMVTDLDGQFKRMGLDSTLHPDSSAVFSRMNSQLSDAPKTLTELDTLRQLAGDAAGSVKPADAMRGNMMKDAIDKLVESSDLNASVPDVVSGNAQKAADALREARANWSALKKSEAISWEQQRAGIQADRSGGGANIDNSLRQRMAALLLNNKGRQVNGFSPEEWQAVRDAVKGNPVQNALRQVGRYSPENGPVATAAGIGTGLGGGAFAGPLGSGLGAVAVPATGFVAKRLADAMSGKAVDYASALVRSGADPAFVAPKLPQSIKGRVLAQALLAPELRQVPANQDQRNAVRR